MWINRKMIDLSLQMIENCRKELRKRTDLTLCDRMFPACISSRPPKIFLCALVISHFDYCNFFFLLVYTSAEFPFFREMRMALINQFFSPVAVMIPSVFPHWLTVPLWIDFELLALGHEPHRYMSNHFFLFIYLALHSCSLHPFGICLRL